VPAPAMPVMVVGTLPPPVMVMPVAAPAAPPAAPPWPAVQPTPMPTVQPLLAGSLCATASSCSRCTALPECGWCGLEQKCVDGTKLGPKMQQCLAYDFMHCANIACDARNTCTDCLADHGCGWCASKARCAKGDGNGPYTASSCPAPRGFVGGRAPWAHAFTAMKCQDTPTLHSSELWDNLRGMMYKSQARIARMEAQAAVVPPPPVKPCATAVAPPPPPPATPPPPAYFVMTTWIMPAAPTTTTAATVTKKPTTTAKPCPTQTVPLATPAPQPEKPPIEVHVDINQHVRNKAEAMAHLPEKEEAPVLETAAAPAAAGAGSPGLVVPFAPAPAGPMAFGPPPGGSVPVQPVDDVPPAIPEVEAPAVPEGVPEVEAPAVEVPEVR